MEVKGQKQSRRYPYPCHHLPSPIQPSSLPILLMMFQLQQSFEQYFMLLALCRNIIKTIATIRYKNPNNSLTLTPSFSFCIINDTNFAENIEGQEGTEYSNWVLARSAKNNHDVSYLKRRYGRDRYSIHKLTNMEFMCSLINREDKYHLNLNEKIVLLAQMNHVCNVLKKDKGIFSEFGQLTEKIMAGIRDPEDYICMGTFMNVLVDLGDFNELIWIYIMDTLFVRKYDEQYDQLFGIYCGLYKYKQNIEQISDYFELQKNKVIFNIPIIYRNSLETMRQYVKYNIYNLKECRLLFRSLHRCSINEKYFWKSVSDWFNIYIKEQLQRKEFQEYFIVAESSVQKVLFDDGVIRPRSILQELAEIAFILSQHGYCSKRFITFIENLIIYSIENGSELFIKFLDIEKSEYQKQREIKSLNQHMKFIHDHEQLQLAKMQKKYKTIFVNPTEIGSEALIHTIIVVKRAYERNEESNSDVYDEKRGHSIDNRVLNWLVVKLCQPKMKYTVNQLLKIIECRDILSSLRIDIRSLVLEKIKDVREKTCSLDDLKDIFMFLPLLEFQSVSYILEHFLSRAHPKDILQLTQLFESESMSPEDYEQLGYDQVQPQKPQESKIDRSHLLPKQKNKRWMPYLTNYFLKLPGAVNSHQRYYSFQQNCYFLYLLLKNQEYWQKKIDYEYLGQMETLKHSIKIASYSRGFKLQMGTYFYKLMNYIDLVAFFDGG